MSLFKATISDARSGKSNPGISSRISTAKDRSNAAKSIIHGLNEPAFKSKLNPEVFTNQSLDNFSKQASKSTDNMAGQKSKPDNYINKLSNRETAKPEIMQHDAVNTDLINAKSKIIKVSETWRKNQIRPAVPETTTKIDKESQKKNTGDLLLNEITLEKEKFIAEINSEKKDKLLTSDKPGMDREVAIHNRIFTDSHRGNVDGREGGALEETNTESKVISSVNNSVHKVISGESADNKFQILDKTIKESISSENTVEANILADVDQTAQTGSPVEVSNTQQSVQIPDNDFSQNNQDVPLQNKLHDTSSQTVNTVSHLQKVSELSENITQKTQAVLQNNMNEESRSSESNKVLNDSIINLRQDPPIVKSETKNNVDSDSMQDHPATLKAMVMDNLAASRNNMMQPVKEPQQASYDSAQSTEVKIGQVDVYIEAPHRTGPGTSSATRPSASVSSRHYLRRL